MISKPIISLGALALASISAAKPIPAFRDIIAKRGSPSSHSFNGYKGYGSMSHFDDFYGSEDFSGVSQTLVQEKQVVCHSVEVEVVQQHLAVIREWYKKIITEQVCEVEVQTIVHHQFLAGCEGFNDDIRRTSNRHVSYDHEIASKIVHIHDSSSECVTDDLGFSGHDIGSHAISYSGDNWNSHSSSIVSTAWNHAKQSHGYSGPNYVSSWSSSYVPPSYTYVDSNTYGYAPTYTYGSSYGGSYGYGSYVAPPPSYTGISYGGYGSSYSPPSDCGSSDCSPPPPPSDCGSSDCSSPPPPSDCGSSDCSPPPPPSDCGSSDCSPPPPPCNSSDCSPPPPSDCGSSDCSAPPPPPSDCSSPSGCPSNATVSAPPSSDNSTSVALPTDSSSAPASSTSLAVATEDPGVPASAPAATPTA